MSLTGRISNISRGSLHDGTGIRTVVYFKGCGLKCAWCHNPETLNANPDIMYMPNKCIACGECIKLCPQNHRPGPDKMIFARENCRNCGECALVCPTGALSATGKEMTTDELLHEIKKDMHYYTESGGGVTLSGGECLIQADFAVELLKRCKELNIHTAIESAFFVPYKNIEKVLQYTDLIFADLKHHNTAIHKQYTGQGNELIIENIRKTSEVHKNIIIRIPLIPGVNDNVTDMEQFRRIIKTFGKGVTGVELLKYNYLAESKYNSLDMQYSSFGHKAQTDEKIAELKSIIDNYK